MPLPLCHGQRPELGLQRVLLRVRCMAQRRPPARAVLRTFSARALCRCLNDTVKSYFIISHILAAGGPGLSCTMLHACRSTSPRTLLIHSDLQHNNEGLQFLPV